MTLERSRLERSWHGEKSMFSLPLSEMRAYELKLFLTLDSCRFLQEMIIY